MALVIVGYHAYSWWKVAPKTTPDLRLGGRPFPEMAITVSGLLATLAASVVVYVIVRGS